MIRKNAVLTYFQKKNLLRVENKRYAKHAEALFHWMITADDITRDVTSQLLILKGKQEFFIISKQQGILAGIEELNLLLKNEADIRFSPFVSDGDQLAKGDRIARITGESTRVLSLERTLLNIIGRMSGIATETYQLGASLHAFPNPPFIAATRKTPLMFLDKKAVSVGGGLTHRLSLSDSVLIKDTHLASLQNELPRDSLEEVITEAVHRMMQTSLSFFEIEVETPSQADAAITAFSASYHHKEKVMALLLDNFTPKQAMNVVSTVKQYAFYDRLLIDASGEITQSNLSSWATTGVDLVSLGAITHSPKTFNLSMQS